MKENIKPVEFIFPKRARNLSTAAQIATKFITFNPLIIIPISTPSAQSIYSAAKDSHFLQSLPQFLTQPALSFYQAQKPFFFVTGLVTYPL